MVWDPVSRHICKLFEESRNSGQVTLVRGEETQQYFVEWEEQDLSIFLQRCQKLLEQLTLIAEHYYACNAGKMVVTAQAPRELGEIGRCYVQSSDDGGLNRETLARIWKKILQNEPLMPEETVLHELSDLVFRQDALRRLPYKKRMPIQLQASAQIYVNHKYFALPEEDLQHAACCLAEELLLYHHARPFHICRRCGRLFYGEENATNCPDCGYRLRKGVDF